MKNEVLRNNKSQRKNPFHSPTIVSGECPDFSNIHLDPTGVRILKLIRAASPQQLLHNLPHACQTHMAPKPNAKKRDSLQSPSSAPPIRGSQLLSPSLRWLTGNGCHAPPAPRCRGRTAACASGADGRTSTAEVRRLHLCTLARWMVGTATPAGHQWHGHPATQCQLGTSISDRVRITPQALQQEGLS